MPPWGEELSTPPSSQLSMDNGTTTLEGPLLLQTQFELVSPTTAAGTLYGIAFTLYCLYVQSHSLLDFVMQIENDKQDSCLVANAWVAQDAYIKHGDHPGGAYAYISSSLTVGFGCQTTIDNCLSPRAVPSFERDIIRITKRTK
ncbi:hypothetical protein AGABI2DRAFT_121394 [Agaricus bisporus var. bisporus H97]|uniref:hypothetical protein n=1 Tax=Agaricus bisporus var. bisporus (strain H97 / ATCC MYA-4626 / FGSC 10389) TaxID=936046 RepID=UPI00029F6460|nr:hypothetical protein AGABI2DRAFT_121394 [Agaricus bisporus var. bisporus H97]EKV44209.1 hypothetical protein AGABI2DRAFT_121394 [Agaricus bisporus var. bisporus H97]